MYAITRTDTQAHFSGQRSSGLHITRPRGYVNPLGRAEGPPTTLSTAIHSHLLTYPISKHMLHRHKKGQLHHCSCPSLVSNCCLLLTHHLHQQAHQPEEQCSQQQQRRVPQPVHADEPSEQPELHHRGSCQFHQRCH